MKTRDDRIAVQPDPAPEGAEVEVTAPDATSVTVTSNNGTSEATFEVVDGVAKFDLPAWATAGSTVFISDSNDPAHTTDLAVVLAR